MTDMTVWTYDWVPNGPRGHVRDLRLRWALIEAGLPFTIRTVAFADRDQPDHLARQPFGQVPCLTDGAITLFESGACLLHLAEKSEVLMPRDLQGRAETLQWLIAGLNSVEMVTVPWWFIGLKTPPENPMEGWMQSRLSRLAATLSDRDWLAAGRFTVADILMADVLRIPQKRGQLDAHHALQAYVARALDRPAFQTALTDQLAHFAAADQARAQG
ncbi:MAG: glutathione S-transferase family protein [Rhodobacteraceae bacterium]|nr:glutathione S-transferase family protein [Paracoccaceae bacterium]